MEILLEVTEDREIVSGRWDLLQQTTLPIVEEVDVDLKKKIGVRIDGYYFFFHIHSVSLREALGCIAPRRGGAKEGYTRVPRI